MKKFIAIFLLFSLLLSGCDAVSQIADQIGNKTGSPGKTAVSGEINRKTGVELHDKAPDLAEVGVEEYLAWFENSGAMTDMGEFTDLRDPFQAAQAAEKEALGKNFEEFYIEQSPMISYFENLVEKNLDAYNEDKDLDDSVFLYLTALYSWDLSMELAKGASFSEAEDWGTLEKGIVMAAEMFGGTDVAVTRNAPHNYTITYTDSNGARITDHYRADAGNGIQMLTYKDDRLHQFFEYVNLGNDRYVWQSISERLLLEYKDKVVYSAWYAKLNEDAQRYTENDLLYGGEVIPDPVWVMEKEEFHTQISYDGTTLEVTTENFFFGGTGHAVISPVEQ